MDIDILFCRNVGEVIVPADVKSTPPCALYPPKGSDILVCLTRLLERELEGCEFDSDYLLNRGPKGRRGLRWIMKGTPFACSSKYEQGISCTGENPRCWPDRLQKIERLGKIQGIIVLASARRGRFLQEGEFKLLRPDGAICFGEMLKDK